MSDYHESWDAVPEEARRFHRALKSLQEEIEAVDWYHQRLSVTGDASLVALLAHNRDEEMEHASMLLEWLRRTMPGWDVQLRRYLFTTAPLLAVETNSPDGDEAAERTDDGDGPPPLAHPSSGANGLGLGDLRGGRA